MNKKIRIAHVLKSSLYSGAENVVLTIIKELRIRYDFLYIATDGPIRDKLEEAQVPYALVDKFNEKNVKKVLKEYDPDIVHAHDFSASVVCALIGGYKLISHLHYDPPWAQKWNAKTLVYTILSKRISKILAVSFGSYQNLVFSDLLKQKVEILENPIDKKRILSLGGTEKEKEYDLIFVGRLTEQKNPQMFIDIVYELKKLKKNIHCVMVGGGELETVCKQVISEYGLQKNIELLGFQQNPYKYMCKSKILCMTSSWEGYGLVAAEASILGTPVLSTKTGGVTAIFGRSADEFCENVSDFVKKINVLLNDVEIYHEWEQKALKRTELFTAPDGYANKLSLIYERELKTDENVEEYKN